jgi:hypothetical protein
MSTLRLSKEENLTVKSWINDKQITDSSWEVYSNSEDDNNLIIVLQNNTSNAKVRLEITKNIPYENN